MSKAKEIISDWITIIEMAFPKGCEFSPAQHTGRGYEIYINRKLPETGRPNKLSKGVLLIISNEAVEDCKDPLAVKDRITKRILDWVVPFDWKSSHAPHQTPQVEELIISSADLI